VLGHPTPEQGPYSFDYVSDSVIIAQQTLMSEMDGEKRLDHLIGEAKDIVDLVARGDVTVIAERLGPSSGRVRMLNEDLTKTVRFLGVNGQLVISIAMSDDGEIAIGCDRSVFRFLGPASDLASTSWVESGRGSSEPRARCLRGRTMLIFAWWRRGCGRRRCSTRVPCL
jgi:hypothetical protein